MTNHTWYEVRLGSASTTHYTLTEAKNELYEMRKGYPEHKCLSEENHSYWKRHGEKAEIYKIEQKYSHKHQFLPNSFVFLHVCLVEII